MKRWETWTMHAAAFFVGLSGIGYGVFKYFIPGHDPDSPIGSPWQTDFLKIHLLAAPILVFALGLIFRVHALPRARGDERSGRKSGLGLILTAAPVVMSGYVIQALTGEAARRWTGWIHAALGVLWLAAYLGHLAIFRADPAEE